MFQRGLDFFFDMYWKHGIHCMRQLTWMRLPQPTPTGSQCKHAQLGNQQQLCQFYIGYSISVSWRLNAHAGLKKNYCSISMHIISSIEWWWTSIASCGKSLKPPQTYCKLVLYIYVSIPHFTQVKAPPFKKNIETIDSVNTWVWVKTRPVGPKNHIGDLYRNGRVIIELPNYVWAQCCTTMP